MQRVLRPVRPPQFLTSEQVINEKRKIFSYLRREDSDRRQRRDGLDEDILFDGRFRDVLSEVFHEKCAYCESKVGGSGRITHHRPLRFGRDSTANGKDYYLWFAFEWRNLLYTCHECAKLKGDSFPIAGSRADFLSNFEQAVIVERALIVDPAAENPGKHIQFSFDGRVSSLTEAGTVTIDCLKLERMELIEARRWVIEHLCELLAGDDQTDRELELELYHRLSPLYAHSGAAQGVLRRALNASRLLERPMSRTPEVFARRFSQLFVRWKGERRAEFLKVVEKMRSDETRPQAPSEPAMSQPIGRAAPIQLPTFSAADRELARISISNFKAISQLDLSFRPDRAQKSGVPAVMILGENSTGKSSVLAATALALVGEREASKLREHFSGMIHSARSEHFDQLDEPEILVQAGFHYSAASAFFRYDPLNRTNEGGSEPATVILGYGPRRYFDRKKSEHAPGAAARIRTLFDPLYTIPYPGEWLRKQTGRRFDTIVSALRVVLALDEDDSLVLEPDYLAVRANGRTTPIEALSEGYRSVFIMTVDIIREMLNHWDELERAHGIVLIDELETHLHPRWKMQVMSSLRKVFPRVQFVCTTHDPLCLRGMDDGEVIVLQRNEDNQIFKIGDLPSVKGMSAEQLLTSDYFGLSSTVDPGIEFDLAMLAGDVVRQHQNGRIDVTLSAATRKQIANLVLGDSPSEQILQQALSTYLREREARHRNNLPKLRANAVETVLRALRSTGG